jgi:hypothetical protein
LNLLAAAERAFQTDYLKTALDAFGSEALGVAVINPSLQAKPAVAVALPAGQVSDAVSGQPVPIAGNRIRADLQPCQLRSFRVR